MHSAVEEENAATLFSQESEVTPLLMSLLQLYDVIRQQTQFFYLPAGGAGKKVSTSESGCSVRNAVRATALTWTLGLLNVKVVRQGLRRN